MYLKQRILILITFLGISATNLSAQSINDFLGNWTGTESLTSPELTYENHNISVQIETGGDREGFHVYTSSSDFLYNENLSWAYHYFGFDKDVDQLIFFRRFITPIGSLGFDEKRYQIISWNGETIVAEYSSHNGQTSHLIRIDLQTLKVEPLQAQSFRLNQNYPNPFNPSTSIDISIEKEMQGSLKIYDLSGQEIKSLKQGTFSPGEHTFQWNGTNYQNQPVSTGTYLYRFMTDGIVQSHKMLLLK